MAELTTPDNIVWIDGSKEQTKALQEQAVKDGTLEALNPDLLPNCFLHRTAVNDVARVENAHLHLHQREGRTQATSTTGWILRSATTSSASSSDGSMKGMTMYVIPYSMGVVGSDFAKIGIELTDSIYVVLNMLIMTRVGAQVIRTCSTARRRLRQGPACSKAELDRENRYIVSLPGRQHHLVHQLRLRRKRTARQEVLRTPYRLLPRAGRRAGWQSICSSSALRIPNGEIKYVTAAFPSACGKTNLAMLIPPEVFRKKGYKVLVRRRRYRLDAASARTADCTLSTPRTASSALLPAPTKSPTPTLLLPPRSDTIFTNVVHDLDNNTVWWEGLDNNPPKNAIDWKGNKWDYTKYDKKDKSTCGAHPNSRFTAAAKNCPCISPEFDNPAGVPISAIIFGGRRAKTAPLVYQSTQLAERHLRRLHHGFRDYRSCSRRCRRSSPRSYGYASFRRLRYGRLLPALARHGQEYPRIRRRSSTSTGSVPMTRVTSFGPATARTMRVVKWILDRCEDKAGC